MLELGEQSDLLHEEVGREAAAQKIDLVVACGTQAKHLYDGAVSAGACAIWYPDRDTLIPQLKELIRKGDTVLVKASHSCRFELITEQLKELVF